MNNNESFIENELINYYDAIGTHIPIVIIKLIEEYLNNFVFLNNIINKKIIWRENEINRKEVDTQSTVINGEVFFYKFVIDSIQLHEKKFIKLLIKFTPYLWIYFYKFDKIKFYFIIYVIFKDGENVKLVKINQFKYGELKHGEYIVSISSNIPADALKKMAVKFEILSLEASAGIFCKRLTKKKTRKI